jgi:hypothetical protein
MLLRSTVLFAAGWLALLAGAPAGAAQGSGPCGGDDDCSAYAFEVDCRALSDADGYVASATGMLQVTRRVDAEVRVSGSLDINTKLANMPDRTRPLPIEGRVDILGRMLLASVVQNPDTEDDELLSINLVFADGLTAITDRFGTEYETDCTYTRGNLPPTADLIVDPGLPLRFETLDGQVRARIALLNVGTVAISAPELRVRIGELELTGALYDGELGTNTIDVGHDGALLVDLPEDNPTRCAEYPVELDIDHRVQKGGFDPFGNDTRSVQAPCLRWDTPITDDALGEPANALIAGKTLGDIINSRAVARIDGNVCSNCHSPGSGRRYSPPAGVSIGPSTVIGGLTWDGRPGGLVDYFLEATGAGEKPQYLEQALVRWRGDGAL